MAHEHWLNADFDLSLKPRGQPQRGQPAARYIADLMWHAVLLAEAGDSVQVPEEPPDDYLESLERAGLQIPEWSVQPAISDERTFSPMGWNADAISRNSRYQRPADHPTLAAVTMVNARSYLAQFEHEHFPGGHVVAVLKSEADLQKKLAGLPERPEGWIIKAEHSNAAFGNRRLRHRRLSDGERAVARRLFEEDNTAVLEKWRPRTRDLCATFEVTTQGDAAGFQIHENFNTADGALIGALFEKDHPCLAEWRQEMHGAVTIVAATLAADGYFGPVAMDAFVWNDGGRERLRPLVDLNARRGMSAGAYRLWRRLGGRGAAYWRFCNRRKFSFPSSHVDLEDALGEVAFKPDTGMGVLAVSPLWLGAERRCPAKTALYMAGLGRKQVLELDTRIRELFEK
jgi:hypothetical protein